MAFTPEVETKLRNLILQEPKIISELEAETLINGDEILPIEDGEATYSLSINDLADFTISKIPAQAAATEGEAGIAPIATQAEMTTGTNDAKFATPLKVKTQITNQIRLGAYLGTSPNVNYLAGYDGFLIANCSKSTFGGSSILVYSDNSTTPTTLVGKQNVDAASGVADSSVTVAIKKGNYYRYEIAGGTSTNVLFSPILND